METADTLGTVADVTQYLHTGTWLLIAIATLVVLAQRLEPARARSASVTFAVGAGGVFLVFVGYHVISWLELESGADLTAILVLSVLAMVMKAVIAAGLFMFPNAPPRREVGGRG